MITITCSVQTPLSFDLEAPPAIPPGECVEVIVWHLAVALLNQHNPGCPTCQHAEFCDRRWLARQGLLIACGRESLLSDYWHGQARQRWAEFSSPVVRQREVNPAWWEAASRFGGEPMADILARRDMGKVFAFLRSRGWSRTAISAATGLAEDAIGKVRSGNRKITSYDVLERIAKGLHIPREAMGLGNTRPSPDTTTLGETLHD